MFDHYEYDSSTACKLNHGISLLTGEFVCTDAVRSPLNV